MRTDSAPSTPDALSRAASPVSPLGAALLPDLDAGAPSSEQLDLVADTAVQIDASTWDWAGRVEAYRGQAKIDRLIHLARRVPHLRVPCSEAALALIKQTPNVQLYQQVARLRATAPHAPAFVPDEQWIAMTAAQNHSDQEQLINALGHYRFNGAKESVRVCFSTFARNWVDDDWLLTRNAQMAHLDLAEFYRATGQLRPAQMQYQETREFASSVAQTLEMTMGLAEVALQQLSYDVLHTLVGRAEGIVSGLAEAVSKTDEAKLDEASAALSIGLTPTGGLGYKRSLITSPPITSPGAGGSNATASTYRAGGLSAADTDEAASRRGGFQTHGAAADGGPSAAVAGKKAQVTRQIRLFRDKLHVMGGIAALGMRKYEQALHCFSRVDPASARHWNHISTLSDVAMYASLCAVLALSRKEMGRRLLRREGPQSEAANEVASKAANNAEGGTATGQGITGLLEYNPQARELLWKYYEGEFGPIRTILGDATAPDSSRLTLDLHLGQAHLFATMADAIVTHSVRDLLRSYNFVGIDDMAAALALPSTLVLDKVKELWDRDEANVRIDMVNRVRTRHSSRHRPFKGARSCRVVSCPVLY